MIESPSSTGLSDSEAALRLAREGPNEPVKSQRKGFFPLLTEIIREPMFLLLIGCGTIYWILGDPHEALMLLGFVLIVAGITLYQEGKTERTLTALRNLASPRALVLRSAQKRNIPGREVVRGDVIILNEGNRVPADATLLSATNLAADESLLTGESVPVPRSTGDPVFAGTTVVKGQGLGLVKTTGSATELGKIGSTLVTTVEEKTPLQNETRKLVRLLAIIGLLLCVLTVLAYGFRNGDWTNGFLAGLTLAMAILPNELPAILMIFLALGAWRISSKQVLTRRIPAVESLGEATVLCVDKTGTLTVNQMSIQKLETQDQSHLITPDSPTELPEPFQEILEFGILACQNDPFDPMEKAFHQLGRQAFKETRGPQPGWEFVCEYPLSDRLFALSRVWRPPQETGFIIAAKGAPEAILDLCHVDPAFSALISKKTRILAQQGLRVLGIAKARRDSQDLPTNQHDFDFQFLGLIGLADPLRAKVPAAIEECHHAGIRVLMITGDHPDTAQSIARSAGLNGAAQLMTGKDLDQMTEIELQKRVQQFSVFARTTPSHKLRLVKALKANGEIVAMTGDGVNDAPALKSAHIGIAMGNRGTDVAREAASLVLLNDDFTSIVQAVRLGRRIFDNLRNALAYILAIHIPIAGLSFLPVVFGLPLVLLPVHIAFLHLIIEPACSFVFEAEPEQADVMNRPPRPPGSSFFNRRALVMSLLQGVTVLIVVLLVFVIALNQSVDRSPDNARALTFTTLMIANLTLILSNRSWTAPLPNVLHSPNRPLWFVVGGAVILLLLILYVPFLRTLFRFSFLHPLDLVLCLAGGALSVIWFEALKWLNGYKSKRR